MKNGEVNKLGVMTGTHIRAIEIKQKAVGVLHRQQRAFVLSLAKQLQHDS